LHFGLGAATKIDRVEIHWPSGKTDTLTDLASDQFYSVLEGSGVVPAERIRPTPPPKQKPATPPNAPLPPQNPDAQSKSGMAPPKTLFPVMQQLFDCLE
jgi:hypothetical protein